MCTRGPDSIKMTVNRKYRNRANGFASPPQPQLGIECPMVFRTPLSPFSQRPAIRYLAVQTQDVATVLASPAKSSFCLSLAPPRAFFLIIHKI